MSGARRIRVSRAERRADLLRAAGEVFAARGFHAASMDEIAERVGVSKPVIYSHFGSKEALYFAYVEAAGAELLDAIVSAALDAARTGPAQQLHAGAHAFFTFVDEHRDGFVILYGELAARGAPARREVVEIRRRIVRLVRTLLDDAVARSGVDPEAIGGTESLATAYVGAGESLADWWLEHPGEDAAALTARLMNVTWIGFEDLVSDRTTRWPTRE